VKTPPPLLKEKTPVTLQGVQPVTLAQPLLPAEAGKESLRPALLRKVRAEKAKCNPPCRVVTSAACFLVIGLLLPSEGISGLIKEAMGYVVLGGGVIAIVKYARGEWR
jgi:hypothetical protein